MVKKKRTVKKAGRKATTKRSTARKPAAKRTTKKRTTKTKTRKVAKKAKPRKAAGKRKTKKATTKTTKKVGRKKRATKTAKKKPRKTVKAVSGKKKAQKTGSRTLAGGNKRYAKPVKAEKGGHFEVKSFLNQNNIKYDVIKHTPAFTAQQIAANAHVSGRDFAKTVIVKVDGKLAMVVEPAHGKVDFDALKRELHAQKVELALEAEFRDKFPNCEVGAMPPFGNLYGMEVFVDESLTKEKEIAFNAGTHSELVKISFKDFLRLVNPRVIHS